VNETQDEADHASLVECPVNDHPLDPIPARLKKILFVDDEPAVLAALQNLLRRHRRLWDMSFALGPTAALAELERARFDIIVTDMRMPVVDGAAFLRVVQQRQPEAVRIILSGYSEREMMLRGMVVAHQYVSKPCDPAELERVIARAITLQRTLASPRIREVVGRIDALPSVPAVFRELSEAIERPSTSARDIARIVERDPAICAKVLQLANSAFFGRAQRHTGALQAVSFLGVEVLRGLALTAGVFGASVRVERHLGTTLDALQKHALETALVARAIAPPCMRDDAFTAGLLHDIGRLVLASCVADQNAALVNESVAGRRPLAEVEREHLGITHAEVGAYLLGLWGLPNHIVEAVALHDFGADPHPGAYDLGTIVHAADVICNELAGSPTELPLDEARLERAGVHQRLGEWTEVARATLGLQRQAS